MPDECEEFSTQVMNYLKEGKLKNNLNESVFLENQLLTVHNDVIDTTLLSGRSSPANGPGGT